MLPNKFKAVSPYGDTVLTWEEHRNIPHIIGVAHGYSIRNSTGVQDKEGQDIYDGDTLLSLNGDEFYVEYEAGAFWCKILNAKERPFDGRLGDFRMRLCPEKAKSMTVAGNYMFGKQIDKKS